MNLSYLLLLPLLPPIPLLTPYSLYLLTLSAFHGLEFLSTALYNQKVATASSFVVDHSEHYTMAFLGASLEYWLTSIFRLLSGVGGAFWGPLRILGLAGVAGGQWLRFTAMMQCGDNFNHIIQTGDSASNHALVTSGVYGVFRHPSYVGWFYWSISTQLLLGNRLCVVGYAWAGWRFFKARIPYEESTLEELFGKETYGEYRERTWIGIPGILGGGKGGARKKD